MKIALTLIVITLIAHFSARALDEIATEKTNTNYAEMIERVNK